MSKPISKQFYKNENGVALIIVLWMLALLTVIVTQFAFFVRVEGELSRNYKDEVIAYQLAKAGFHMAVMELLNPEVEGGVSGEDGQVTFIHKTAEDEDDKEKPQANRQKIFLGDGYFSYKIIDEEGKLDLNQLAANNNQDEVLRRLLEKTAGIVDEEASTIIDALYDWYDKDDLLRLHGAEDDYYQGSSPEYHCKNAPFDTVAELLLVKGVTQEVFYGKADSPQQASSGFSGLQPHLTVWSDGRFNQQTANSITLSAKFGAEKGEEIEANLLDEEGVPQTKYVSQHYQIVSTGYSSDGSSKRTIKVVVKISAVGKENASYTIRYWNDNYLPSQQ